MTQGCYTSEALVIVFRLPFGFGTVFTLRSVYHRCVKHDACGGVTFIQGGCVDKRFESRSRQTMCLDRAIELALSEIVTANQSLDFAGMGIQDDEGPLRDRFLDIAIRSCFEGNCSAQWTCTTRTDRQGECPVFTAFYRLAARNHAQVVGKTSLVKGDVAGKAADTHQGRYDL